MGKSILSGTLGKSILNEKNWKSILSATMGKSILNETIGKSILSAAMGKSILPQTEVAQGGVLTCLLINLSWSARFWLHGKVKLPNISRWPVKKKLLLSWPVQKKLLLKLDFCVFLKFFMEERTYQISPLWRVVACQEEIAT